MRKFLKWLLIALAAGLAILAAGTILLTLFLPLDQIKDFAVARLSETLRREVRIEKVSFNIFSGVKLEKLYIGNRAGFAKKPFVSADSIELRYAFWPLFSRQLLIHEVRLVRPEILVEKNTRGEFNYSDLAQPKPVKRPTVNDSPDATDKRPAQPPFDLLVSSFSVAAGKILYMDNSTGTSSEIKDLNINVSGFELALIKPINFKVSADIIYQNKPVPVALVGKVSLDLNRESAALRDTKLSIAGESATISADIANWKNPAVNFAVTTRGLSVDPILAVFAAPAGSKKTTRPGELTANINRAMAGIPNNLSVDGKLDLANLTFQKFKVDKIDAALTLKRKLARAEIKTIKIYDGVLSGHLSADLGVPGLAYSVSDLRLAGFNAAPFSNAAIETFLTGLADYKDLLNKVYGRLDLSASLKGRGVEPGDILVNLSLDGSLALKNGELKRLKTLAEIGKTIKSNSLQQDIKFGGLYTAVSFKDRVVSAKALKIEENDFKLYFNGGADLKTLRWVPGNRLTLKLAPALTSDLPKEFSLFRDKAGWFELAFELTGDLKKPFPRPILDKPFEAAIGKLKVKIEAKKVEIEESVKAELATKEAELKKEAEKQLRQFLKF
ncbi:hypothetical protein A2625_04540 [candidate division WOR-1 bacterium RIFCSPHIGHO2_01_FULL_53_15]|uniref:AsmA domain-containing protein n=1 Tax=candidate division WOR-1 bacterium RIFCSPHIGHO2_01_FULL_53_15 TaxID=1802564 RepID=A0A1F4PZB5_UNCSA|nr:MAG: hypothetical protein A2625_04540 [candidate division WOR-1 bacterium RIFCSPHIGHO2_01_FULL_53_15]OGC10605.1 MAG: hypothetical protein A3D23_03760 [candidate division WOR-1 bacterium RIFCSPHIGHO2_02_FULL_53_26]